jgi:dTDP-glucose 4,6-dehydratase
MSRKILVTGGSGFIGSNCIPFFLFNYDYTIINLDKLTYAADPNNLRDIEANSRYIFIKGCITDEELVNELFTKYEFDGVINFAAESHVDNSIHGPKICVDTNIVGTFNLLEHARKHWMERPFVFKEDKQHCRFHHISTDEVYGSIEHGLFSENTPYAPNSPYSASKAASDFLARSYFHTFGLNLTTSNCSNNYGPKQHIGKLIPTIIRKALDGQPIPIYGQGINVRDWLYVLDHCRAIDLIFHHGICGESYNIGGHNEKTNLEVAHIICKLLDEKIPRSTSYVDTIEFVADRPGHDLRYAIDPTKIENNLGWRAQEPFSTGIEKTVDWYLRYLQ